MNDYTVTFYRSADDFTEVSVHADDENQALSAAQAKRPDCACDDAAIVFNDPVFDGDQRDMFPVVERG